MTNIENKEMPQTDRPEADRLQSDMKQADMPRVVIAGTNSGVGKTTIVAGLLAALTEQGKRMQAYKVGPDYIDPGFHKLASGNDCYNLDTWLVPPEEMIPFFAGTAASADMSIIEGVMGLYDGGREGISSTAEIAVQLGAPVILVINCQSMGESAAAIAQGFRDYDPRVDIRGVILNRLGSDNHELMIRQAMERLGMPVIGAIHRDERMNSPERHLGLTPVTETDPTEAIHAIREAVKNSVDLEALLVIAKHAPALTLAEKPRRQETAGIRLGIAYDEAFSFYYPASLQALAEEGAELVYFSPLRDKQLPEVDGLVFGGGFPEMFLTELSGNRAMKRALQAAHEESMPIYAECGGLMYLCETITDFEGQPYPMVGLVPANCVMQERLQRVGYVTAEAAADNILAARGEKLRGHEFHFSTTEPSMEAFPEGKKFPWAFCLEGGRKQQTYQGGYVEGNLLASYLHINFAGSRPAARRFLSVCRNWRKGPKAP